MTPSGLSCCGDQCGKEEAGSVTVNERIRTIAFQRLLQTRQPVSALALTNDLGGSPVEVEAELAELDRQGLIRRNQIGDVVGSVGLSVEPSRHELHVGDQQFWTWCAYDAVGILAALEASGRVLSRSPLTGTPIDVQFRDGLPVASEVVLFMPDFSVSLSHGAPSPDPGVSVFDDWCPQINLFEDRAASQAWAERRGARGQILSLTEAATRGAAHWQPMVPTARPGDAAGRRSASPEA